MAFPVQPSKKGKKKIGYRRKQSSMPAMAANPVPRDQGVVVNPVAEASSHPAPKKRKDDNWRSRRAVKSAQNKASKAIAARDKAQEESKVSKGKVRDATARVKEVDHELYLHKKANRENSVKVEAEHNLAMKNLTEKFYVDLEEAVCRDRIRNGETSGGGGAPYQFRAAAPERFEKREGVLFNKGQEGAGKACKRAQWTGCSH